MKQISIGKYRGLQQCSTARGAISILALDHRTDLRNVLKPDNPKSVSSEEMINFKLEVVRYVSPAASAVLLDPEYGIAQVVQSGALQGRVGLIAAVDETGYQGDPMARMVRMLPDWSVEKACRMGANGIKLLVYYHPDSSTAQEIENLVSKIALECNKCDLPFYVEPHSYSLSKSTNKLSPEEKRKVVIETARRLTPLGADILKTEFPLEISADMNEASWAKACAELSRASVIPWVLLSASASFEIFLRQVTIACEEGSSGVAVGRAVWSDAVKLKNDTRKNHLQSVVFERMTRVTAVCNALARPWTDLYSMEKPAIDWYKNYPGN